MNEKKYVDYLAKLYVSGERGKQTISDYFSALEKDSLKGNDVIPGPCTCAPNRRGIGTGDHRVTEWKTNQYGRSYGICVYCGTTI